jgi:hypothetical protein
VQKMGKPGKKEISPQISEPSPLTLKEDDR